jgi:anti-sigma-K factor RskA
MVTLRPGGRHTLAGVYALDALHTDAERDRFERHLRGCQACGAQVRGLQATAARLAMAVAQAPPPGLRERVLALIARTAQLPPEPVATHARQPRPARRLAVAAGAVGLVAVIVLGIALVGSQRNLSRERAQARAIAAVLAAPDARILTGTTSHGGTATVIVSAAEHKMVVTTAGLPRLPSAKVYQLWLIGPPHTRSAGLLTAVAGRTQPMLATGLAPGDIVGLTVEPAGGTAKPTTTPILLIPLKL